jgi:drug/metabolite transporter (DMT)-like permease
MSSSRVVEPILRGPNTPPERRPVLGHLMVLAAATLFAVNGVISKVILASGISSSQLAEVRSTGAVAGLALLLLAFRPSGLRLRSRELPFLAFFGVCGLAFVQWFYFIAIHRLAIGIALLIQYLAPLLVALWARFVFHEHVRRRIWIALALALAGLTLVVEVWSGLALDGRGVAAALIAAVALALYVLAAEHGLRRRDAISLSCWGFLFAAVFWAAVEPWWDFPGRIVGDRVSLLGNLADLHLPVWLLMSWMVVLGTIVPFGLVVAALRHVSATRVGLVAMVEPVAASTVAYAWLDESLSGLQLVGGGVVLAAILLAQTSR